MASERVVVRRRGPAWVVEHEGAAEPIGEYTTEADAVKAAERDADAAEAREVEVKNAAGRRQRPHDDA